MRSEICGSRILQLEGTDREGSIGTATIHGNTGSHKRSIDKSIRELQLSNPIETLGDIGEVIGIVVILGGAKSASELEGPLRRFLAELWF